MLSLLTRSSWPRFDQERKTLVSRGSVAVYFNLWRRIVFVIHALFSSRELLREQQSLIVERHPGSAGLPLTAASEPSRNGPLRSPGLRQDVYDLMPRANIADVLLKVDDWTWFWDCFTHQPSGRAADDSDG